MRGHRPKRLALLVLAFAALASLAALRSGRERDPEGRTAEFQRLLGGIGGGASPDPARCLLGFDPRLALSCPHRFGPIPALAGACAPHGAPER